MLRRWLCKMCGQENSEHAKKCSNCNTPKEWKGK